MLVKAMIRDLRDALYLRGRSGPEWKRNDKLFSQEFPKA